MSLADLCEPFFQYACLLNRSARQGAAVAPEQVRAQAKELLADARRQAKADSRLARAYERAEPALVFFFDAAVRNSQLPFAREWLDLAFDFGLEDGDERFFDLLDDAVRDESREGLELLPIFYTCLGLGFAGFYDTKPALLRQRMLDIAAKTRAGITSEAVHASRIVPEAYQHVSTANLIETPGTSVGPIVVVLVGLLGVLLAVNVYLYRSGARALDEAVQRVTDAAGAPLPATTAPAAEKER